MTAPPSAGPIDADPGDAVTAASSPGCPCGGEMWYLPFGYDSWVCRRNTRHWFRPGAGRWSRDAQALADGAA